MNSATVFARLNFINQVTGGLPAPRTGPRQQQPQLSAPGVALGSAGQALAHYLPFILDDNIPEESRQLLAGYAGGPETPLSSEQLRGLVYLILASPQFHLS